MTDDCEGIISKRQFVKKKWNEEYSSNFVWQECLLSMNILMKCRWFHWVYLSDTMYHMALLTLIGSLPQTVGQCACYSSVSFPACTHICMYACRYTYAFSNTYSIGSTTFSQHWKLSVPLILLIFIQYITLLSLITYHG